MPSRAAEVPEVFIHRPLQIIIRGNEDAAAIDLAQITKVGPVRQRVLGESKEWVSALVRPAKSRYQAASGVRAPQIDAARRYRADDALAEGKGVLGLAEGELRGRHVDFHDGAPHLRDYGRVGSAIHGRGREMAHLFPQARHLGPIAAGGGLEISPDDRGQLGVEPGGELPGTGFFSNRKGPDLRRQRLRAAAIARAALGLFIGVHIR